jgi:hypothetical protein
MALLALDLRPAAFLVILGGAFLAIAPFAFGYYDDGFLAWFGDLVTGAVIVALTVVSLRVGPDRRALRDTAAETKPD